MTDVLLVTMDGGGNVPPLLALATILDTDGHRVRVIGHERLRADVHLAGLSFHSYQTVRSWDSTAQQSALRWLPMLNDPNIGVEVAHLCVGDPPDVVVVDCMLLPALKALRSMGIPTVVFDHTFRAYLNGQHRLGAGTVARLCGYPISELWDAADLHLVATLRALDPASRRDQPANVRWIGPLVQGRPSEPDTPPLVLVSMSTNGFRGQTRTVTRIVAALERLSVRAVVTTAGVVDRRALPAASNVEVLEYVDHAELMPRCSLVIGHGAHRSTPARSGPRSCLAAILTRARLRVDTPPRCAPWHTTFRCSSSPPVRFRTND